MSRDFVSLRLGPIIRFYWKPISCLSKTRSSCRRMLVQKSCRASDSRLEGLMALLVSKLGTLSLNHRSDRYHFSALNCLNFKLCLIFLLSFTLIIPVHIYSLTSSSSNPTLCRRDAFLQNATTLVSTFHPHPKPRAPSTAICRPNKRELSGHGSYG